MIHIAIVILLVSALFTLVLAVEQSFYFICQTSLYLSCLEHVQVVCIGGNFGEGLVNFFV